MANIFPAAPVIQVPIFPQTPGIFDLVRFGNAVGDGVHDDTGALLKCIAACDAWTTDLGPQTIPGGGMITVPPTRNHYRITADIPIRRQTMIMGYGPMVSSFVFEGNHGFVFASDYIQGQQQMWLRHLGIWSKDGGVGVWSQGGIMAGLYDCSIGGFDTCMRFEISNLMFMEKVVCASWNGLGNQAPIGVQLMLRVQAGGGATNIHGIRDCQFNGCSIGALCQDGVCNVFRDCNFNGCGTVAQIEGAQTLVFDNCEGEGVTGDTYFRIGVPGGYGSGQINAQQLAIRDCFWSRNEPQVPTIMQFEPNTQIRNLDLSGTTIAGAVAGNAPIKAALGANNVMIAYALQRDRVLMSGSPATLRTTPAIATDLIDKPLFGSDLRKADSNMSATLFPGALSNTSQLIKTALPVNASGTYFTVAGGRVRILEMFFRVTTVIGAGATTMALNANVAGVDSPLSIASAPLATAPVDSLIILTGDPAAALLLGAGAGAIRSSSIAVICNPCTIDSVIIGGTTGALTGYVLWSPIDVGASLT